MGSSDKTDPQGGGRRRAAAPSQPPSPLPNALAAAGRFVALAGAALGGLVGPPSPTTAAAAAAIAAGPREAVTLDYLNSGGKGAATTAGPQPGIDYGCLLGRCGRELGEALLDPRGLHELACLVTCGPSDLACQVRPSVGFVELSISAAPAKTIQDPNTRLITTTTPTTPTNNGRCGAGTCTRRTFCSASTPAPSPATSACPSASRSPPRGLLSGLRRRRRQPPPSARCVVDGLTDVKKRMHGGRQARSPRFASAWPTHTPTRRRCPTRPSSSRPWTSRPWAGSGTSRTASTRPWTASPASTTG